MYYNHDNEVNGMLAVLHQQLAKCKLENGVLKEVMQRKDNAFKLLEDAIERIKELYNE